MFELVSVLAILGVLAMIVTPMLSSRGSVVNESKETITQITMLAVRKSINNDYYSDHFESLPYPAASTRVQHPQLAFLYGNPVTGGTPDWNYDPHTQRGWSGPYLSPGGVYRVVDESGFTTRYGEDGDPCPLDGWGQPIVIQQPQALGSTESMRDRTYARLVSAGPNGVIDTPADDQLPTEIGDDLVVYLLAGN